MKIHCSTVLLLTLAAWGCSGRIGGVSEGSGAPERPGIRGKGGPGTPGGPNDTTCAAGTSAAPKVGPRIRRLTKLEIRNTVADLFSDTTAALTDEIEPDPRPQGYSTGDERSVNPGYM